MTTPTNPTNPAWFPSRVAVENTGPNGGPIENQTEVAGPGGGPINVNVTGNLDVNLTIREETTTEVEDTESDDLDDANDVASEGAQTSAPASAPVEAQADQSEAMFQTIVQGDSTLDEIPPINVFVMCRNRKRRTTVDDIRYDHTKTLGLGKNYNAWVRGQKVAGSYTPEANATVVWKRESGDKG